MRDGQKRVIGLKPLPSLYRKLKQINTTDNALQTVKKKKSEAYNRLLDQAKTMRKEKQFLKLADRLQWMGLREHSRLISREFLFWSDADV